MLEDGGLNDFDDLHLVGLMQGLKQVCHQPPLADHRVIAAAERRGLPQALIQGTMVAP